MITALALNASCFSGSWNASPAGGPDAAGAAMERSERLMLYLQRAFGYSLTGVTSEKVVFLVYGPHDNGKSTLLALYRLLTCAFGLNRSVPAKGVVVVGNDLQGVAECGAGPVIFVSCDVDFGRFVSTAPSSLYFSIWDYMGQEDSFALFEPITPQRFRATSKPLIRLAGAGN